MYRPHITVYRVAVGSFVRDYATKYHAEQMAEALRLHKPLDGMPVTITAHQLPNDPLTRLIAN